MMKISNRDKGMQDGSDPNATVSDNVISTRFPLVPVPDIEGTGH
jgi:hypothetical protein